MTRSDSCWLVDSNIPLEAPSGLAKIRRLPPKGTPIIVDYGSWQCRAGFANETMPSFVFDSIVHRVVGNEKDGGDRLARYIVGRNPPTGASKSSSRSAFENGLLVHSASVERTLDNIFEHLKINGPLIDYPIVITEPIMNPSYCKSELAELLFEGYGVHKLAFSDDILPVFQLHNPGCQNAILINIGNFATNVVLLIHGVLKDCKRIDFGGLQAAGMLLKIIQSKYPFFPVKMTIQQAQYLLWKAGRVAEDYMDTVKKMETAEGIAEHDFTVQFSFPKVDKSLLVEKERQAQALLEKRQEMAQRLRERAEQKKQEKLKAKEDRFKALQSLLDSLCIKKNRSKRQKTEDDEDELMVIDEPDSNGLDEEAYEEMRLHGFDSLDELKEALEEAAKDLKTYKNKLQGIEEEKGEPVYDLVHIPDDQLNEEQLKEKRKQRLLKSSAEAREKLRIEKEQEAERAREQAGRDAEWRKSDLEGWKAHYYGEREKLLKSIKSRQKQREALADRRSQASGARLRNVMSLVDDTSDAEKEKPTSKKPRKAKSSNKDSKDPDSALTVDLDGEDDGFGAKDSDWQIYRQLRRDELSDEEEDEKDHTMLHEIEERLEEHDPGFFDVLAEELSAKATILDLLRTGGRAKIPEEEADAVAHQIHVNVERYRVPEALFQPFIAGLDQRGLIEIIESFLATLPSEQYDAVLANVFLSGGMSPLPGLQERLFKELTQISKAGTLISIRNMEGTLDCWKSLAASHGHLKWLSRAEYEKKGRAVFD